MKKVEKTIGSGDSATVYTLAEEESGWLKARCETKFTHAVKKVFCQGCSEAIAEFYIMNITYALAPDYFIRPLYFVHQDDLDRFPSSPSASHIIYMDQVDNKLLEARDYLKDSLSDNQKIRFVFHCYRLGLICERIGIVHNDLKRGNLFVNDEQIKLTDFGKTALLLSRKLPCTVSLGEGNTSRYNSPEHKQNKQVLMYPGAGDHWSLAILMRFIFLQSNYKFQQESLSDALLDLISRGNQQDPCQRGDLFLTMQDHCKPNGFFAGLSRLIPGPLNHWTSLLPRLPKKKIKNFIRAQQCLCSRYLTVFLKDQQSQAQNRGDLVSTYLACFHLWLNFSRKQIKDGVSIEKIDENLEIDVQACRALVVNLLDPQQRPSTDMFCSNVQHLILRRLRFQILYPPFELPPVFTTHATPKFKIGDPLSVYTLVSHLSDWKHHYLFS